jgi:hypothetical protein
MPTNDLILLDALVEERKQDIAPESSAPDFFEQFAAEQVLKNFDLSYEEIEQGDVDGGDDGGIDRFYSFLDGELITDDTSADNVRRNPDLEIFVIQVKQSKGFSENALLRINRTLGDLFNLKKPLSELANTYNASLLGTIENLRRVYHSISTKFPKITVSVYYASRGTEIHPKVEDFKNDLRNTLDGLFSECFFEMQFLTAGKLVELYRKSQRAEPSFHNHLHARHERQRHRLHLLKRACRQSLFHTWHAPRRDRQLPYPQTHQDGHGSKVSGKAATDGER